MAEGYAFLLLKFQSLELEDRGDQLAVETTDASGYVRTVLVLTSASSVEDEDIVSVFNNNTKTVSLLFSSNGQKRGKGFVIAFESKCETYGTDSFDINI